MQTYCRDSCCHLYCYYCVKQFQLDISRIQRPLDSHCKNMIRCFQSAVMSFFQLKKSIEKAKTSTQQADGRSVFAPLLMSIVHTAAISLKQSLAFTTFVPVEIRLIFTQEDILCGKRWRKVNELNHKIVRQIGFTVTKSGSMGGGDCTR